MNTKNKIIFSLVFLLVGVNIVSAESFFGFYNPLSLQYPGRVESDNSVTFSFIIANGTRAAEFGSTANGSFDGSTGNDRVIGGTAGQIVFAIADWTNPYQIFLIDSGKNVSRVTQIAQVDYSLGFYDPGIWPLGCALSGNCNPIYKIGTLSTLNTQRSGLVDSNGDLFLADGLSVIKFDHTTEYNPSTYLTLSSANGDFDGGGGTQICDMDFDNTGQIHFLICAPGLSQYYSHTVYSGLSRVWVNSSGNTVLPDARVGLVPDATGNITANYTLGTWQTGGLVNLRHVNTTHGFTFIGTNPLATINDFDGMAYLDNWIYIASSGQNKIFRFPTTYSSTTGSGFGAGVTTTAELIYSANSINSLYPTYYNNSNFQIAYNLAYQATATQKNIFEHRIDLIDPNSAAIQSYTITPSCDSVGFLDLLLNPDPLFNCTATKTISFTTATNWQNGTFSVQLLELNTSSGGTALLDSDSFTVLNSTKPATGTGPGGSGSQPNEPISATAIIDLLSNNTFWALIFTVGFMVATGMFAGKAKTNPIIPMIMVGFLSIAVFTILGWLPLWILFSIILIVIVGFAWQQAKNMNMGSQ